MKKLLLAVLLLCVAHSAVAADDLPDLAIRQLTENVYLHTSYKVVDGFGLVDSNGLVVVVNNEAYIIDTPWSAQDTEKLLNWIATQGLAIRGSVSTHFHEDRTAGIGYLNSKSIPTHTSKLTNSILRKAGKAEASREFGSNFWLVENQIEIFYPGPGHSQDNVVVWLPEHGLLFGGCFIRAAESKGLGNMRDAFVSQWPESATRVLERYENARIVVPGHGKVGDAFLLQHTRDLALQASKPAADN